MRRRRFAEAEGGDGGHDGGGMLRWLLTYADMITLLMAFFIMLYSMSILNLNKFREVAVSIRSGFGGVTEGQGKSVMGTNGQFSVKPAPILGESVGVPWRVVSKIQQYIKEEDLDKVVKLRSDSRGLVISLTADKVVFEKGQADLSAGANRILDQVAGVLAQVPNEIRVEGHTCNLPTHTGRYASNWDLSIDRATNVMRYLVKEGRIPADRISATGYADTHPLVPNTNERNRAMNRRVDIVVRKAE